MRFTIATIVISILLFLFSEADASAQMRGRRGMGRRGMMRGMMMGRGRCFGDREFMMNRLKLSEKQIARIGNINGKYMNLLHNYREKLHPEKQELRRILLSKEPDFKKLRAVLKKISDIEIEIRLNKVKQRLEIEKVFSPSQREMLRRERSQNLD